MTLIKKLKDYGHLVMFSHTLFSLPFALMAMLLAVQSLDGVSGSNAPYVAGSVSVISARILPEGRILFWALVALFAGRNGANALNRWVDRSLDAKNPRTAGREIPQGKVSGPETLILTACCYGIFVLAAAMINPLTCMLSPVALVLFTLYSYTKRFTWLCHMVLGFTCGGAAVGGWIAVTGSFFLPQATIEATGVTTLQHIALTPFVLAAVSMFWTAGFDMVYGTQDIDFDRAHGVFSVPARFGLSGALWIARGCHGVMVMLLVSLFWLQVALGLWFGMALSASVVLLCVQHWVVDPSHKARMNVASYHLNQIISPLLLLGVFLDILRFVAV